MEKYFLHRIQEENSVFSKGIEVHASIDDAIRSFWGRMKLGYNNPDKPGMTFVSCKITNSSGNVIAPYDMTWLKDPTESNQFFMHHIKQDGDTISKDIDILDSHDAAIRAFAAAMEYGYNNPRFPNVGLVSCEITDLLSGGMVLLKETWVKPEPEPEPEPEE